MSDNSWIHTYTGRKFYPLKPTVDMVWERDFAHALSNLCRFTGHVKKFYSVAEHSRRVADCLLGRKTNRFDVLCCMLGIKRDLLKSIPQYKIQKGRWGILHDASEGYLNDIARPLKVQPEYEQYRKNEAVLQSLIYRTHGLIGSEPEDLKTIDYKLCCTEIQELFDNHQEREEWRVSPLEGKQYFGWSPKVAEKMFLELYYQLFPEYSPHG